MTTPGAAVEDPLADQTASTPGQPTTARVGTVQAANPVEILMGGPGGTVIEPDALGILGMYRPRVGDNVVLLGQAVDGAGSSGSTWSVLGSSTPASFGDWGAVTNFAQEAYTYTSTVYTAGGPVSYCFVAFYVPPTGKILLSWSAELKSGVAGNITLISPEIRTGSTPNAGTLVLAASDDRQIRNDNAQLIRSADTDLITGLTPGQLLNCTLLHRATAGTSSVSRRRVVVSPAL